MMNMKLLILALIAMVTSACRASAPTIEKLPNMIFAYHEGTPRAHLPAVAWFSGKTIPTIAPDEDSHDAFWRGKLDAAPKFSLEADVYADLSSQLMKLSCVKKSPYVVEFLYESKRSVVRYVATKDFQQLRNAIRSKNIKGHEVLADWPENEK
jgi:hypothetical protein